MIVSGQPLVGGPFAGSVTKAEQAIFLDVARIRAEPLLPAKSPMTESTVMFAANAVPNKTVPVSSSVAVDLPVEVR